MQEIIIKIFDIVYSTTLSTYGGLKPKIYIKLEAFGSGPYTFPAGKKIREKALQAKPKRETRKVLRLIVLITVKPPVITGR